MLTAEKRKWFDTVFFAYNRNLIKRRFHALRVGNFEVLKRRHAQIPLVIYANHSSWWDGLIAYHIWRKCRLDGFVMMEEKQLKNLQLFRKLGAFSVIRENPREAVKSINYAANLLQEKENRSVLIFPQGEIKPNDARPLKFFNGLARIVEKVGACEVIPLAMRYEFLNEFKPEIFVKIGEIRRFEGFQTKTSKDLTKDFENTLTNLLDGLKKEIAAENTAGYEKII